MRDASLLLHSLHVVALERLGAPVQAPLELLHELWVFEVATVHLLDVSVAVAAAAEAVAAAGAPPPPERPPRRPNAERSVEDGSVGARTRVSALGRPSAMGAMTASC